LRLLPLGRLGCRRQHRLQVVLLVREVLVDHRRQLRASP
jgi:hypothetical protein